MGEADAGGGVRLLLADLDGGVVEERGGVWAARVSPARTKAANLHHIEQECEAIVHVKLLVGVEEGESAEGGGCVGFHFSVSFDEDDVLQDAAGGFAVYTY